MLGIGVIFLVATGVLVAIGVATQRRWHRMMATPTYTCGELLERAKTATDLGGSGTFREVCEVVGAARPGPDGEIVAPLSVVPCVWHRQKVTRVSRRRAANGRWERRSTVVHDTASVTTFTVEDDTGRVVVAPDGATVDGSERVHDHFQEGNKLLGALARLSAVLDTPVGIVDVIGHRTEEWVIRPGTRVSVMGEVREVDGVLRLGKPDTGPFVVSTRGREAVIRDARRTQRIVMGLAVLFGAAGIALVVRGLIG